MNQAPTTPPPMRAARAKAPGRWGGGLVDGGSGGADMVDPLTRSAAALRYAAA
jgi:hypothetical protein